ncbi:MAG: hypothetical protein Kow0068_15290 [Marinilabiliales bacterium]
MKIDITPGAISFEDLKMKLEQRFPDYQFTVRSKNFLVAKKSGTVGANILLRKNKIQVAGNFPTMGGQLLFVLSILALGFLIPLIVYFAAFHGKMKALENEIGAYIQDLINNPVSTGVSQESNQNAEVTA